MFVSLLFAATVIIDDFSDGEPNTNSLGGSNSYAGTTNVFSVSVVSDDAPGNRTSDSYSVKITYNAASGQWFYFRFNFPSAQSRAYYDYLELYFKRHDNLSDAFDFEITLYDGTNSATLYPVNVAYGYQGYIGKNPPQDRWLVVRIPLGDFRVKTGVSLDLSNLQYLHIGMGFNTDAAGELYLDDIAFVDAPSVNYGDTLVDFESKGTEGSPFPVQVFYYDPSGATTRTVTDISSDVSQESSLNFTYSFGSNSYAVMSLRFNPSSLSINSQIVMALRSTVSSGSPTVKVKLGNGDALGNAGIMVSFTVNSYLNDGVWTTLHLPFSYFAGSSPINWAQVSYLEIVVEGSSGDQGEILIDWIKIESWSPPVASLELIDDFSDEHVYANSIDGRNEIGLWSPGGTGSFAFSQVDGALKLSYHLEQNDVAYYRSIFMHIDVDGDLFRKYIGFKIRGESVPRVNVYVYFDNNSNDIADELCYIFLSDVVASGYCSPLNSTWQFVAIPLRSLDILSGSAFDFNKLSAVEIQVHDPDSIAYDGYIEIDDVGLYTMPLPEFPLVVDDFEATPSVDSAYGTVYLYQAGSASVNATLEDGSLRVDYNIPDATSAFSISFWFRPLEDNPAYDPRFMEIYFKIRGDDVRNFWVWLEDTNGTYAAWRITRTTSGEPVELYCPFELNVTSSWTEVRIHFGDIIWKSSPQIENICKLRVSVEPGGAQSGTFYMDDIQIRIGNVLAFPLEDGDIGIFFPSSPRSLHRSDIVLKSTTDPSFSESPSFLMVRDNYAEVRFPNMEIGGSYYLYIKQAEGSTWSLSDVYSRYEPGGGSRTSGPYIMPLNVQWVADYLLSLQLDDGAFINNPPFPPSYEIWINPYFGSMAALAMLKMYELTNQTVYKESAAKWLKWYAIHMLKPTDPVPSWFANVTSYFGDTIDGLMNDYKGPVEDYENYPVEPDSTDAYPALFLWALSEYLKLTGDVSYVRDLIKTYNVVSRAIHAMEITLQPDNLTWAKPSYPVKYMMDNAEVVRGYRSAAYVMKVLGNETAYNEYMNRANATAQSLKTYLWDSTRGIFAFAKYDLEDSNEADDPLSFSFNLFTPYPDLDAQLFYYYHVSGSMDAYFSTVWSKIKGKFFRNSLPIMKVYAPRWWIYTVAKAVGEDPYAFLAEASLKMYNYWFGLPMAAEYILAFAEKELAASKSEEVKPSVVKKSLSLKKDVITPNSDGVSDALEVKVEGMDSLAFVIVDIFGNVVKRGEIYASDGEASVDVSDLPMGVYFIRLKENSSGASFSKTFRFAVYKK